MSSQGRDRSGIAEGRPTINLQFYDLSHLGVQHFLQLMEPDAHVFLQECVQSVRQLLYGDVVRKRWKERREGDGVALQVPEIRSVTFCIRPMGGIAHTHSAVLDNDHKEIHLSAGYIAEQFSKTKTRMPVPTPTDKTATSNPTPSLAPKVPHSFSSVHQSGEKGQFSKADAAKEIKGVLVHELVHTLQWTGKDSCPGGLIEGIADWVRMQAGLAPPHWKEKPKTWKGKNWDSGYEITAFFLQWASKHLHEADLVSILNQALHSNTWEKGTLFQSLFKEEIEELWDHYKSEIGCDE